MNIERPDLKKDVLNLLRQRVGKHNAISANELFVRVTGETLYPPKARNQTRVIRSVIRELRRERNPILGGNGYWWAESDAELKVYIEQRLNTAARIFKLNHELSGVPIDRMVEQLKLNLTELEQEDAH